jgi:thioredoxin 1
MSLKTLRKSFKDIIATEPLVLVDFYTEWCGPCKMLKPILEQLHQEVGEDVKILKVDVDRNPRAAADYQIMGVPTLMLFKQGRQVWRQSGVMPLAALKQVIAQHQN